MAPGGRTEEQRATTAQLRVKLSVPNYTAGEFFWAPTVRLERKNQSNLSLG